MSGEKNIGLWGEEYARFAQTKTFGSLDGLRAIAILAVLWHHHANNSLPGWTIGASSE
jgi:peptidoglycan/LPS O-acetylase OafA/YrhL